MFISEEDIKYMLLKTQIFIDSYQLNPLYTVYYKRLL